MAIRMGYSKFIRSNEGVMPGVLSFVGGTFFAWRHHGAAIVVTTVTTGTMRQNHGGALRTLGAGDFGGTPLLLMGAHASARFSSFRYCHYELLCYVLTLFEAHTK